MLSGSRWRGGDEGKHFLQREAKKPSKHFSDRHFLLLYIFFVQSTNCWIVFFMKLDVKAPREKDQNKE
jgi:hypothetical protein